MKPPSPPREPGGFSLLEVLVAMVILTLGATSLIALFAAAAATHKRSVDRTHAALVAEEILSEVQARYTPGATIAEIETSLLEEVPETISGYRWDVLLVRPALGRGGPAVMARTRKAASERAGESAAKTAPLRPVQSAGQLGKKAASSSAPAGGTSGWSEEEVVARVVVYWSESGREMASSFDTILLPRPVSGPPKR